MRRLFIAIPIVMMAVGGSTACATKKFVGANVGEVNDKVNSLSQSLEQTQERTRANEARITDVDQAAQAAAQAARHANAAATAAGDVANAASTKANDLDKANRRLVNEVMLSEDEGNFRFGKAILPDSAKRKIDDMVQQIKQDPKNVYFEIEGYTDNVGSTALNEKLGLERAEAAERYLYERYQVPLHKMNVISYGKERPIAPNKTRNGRAQNRRVVIKVLT
jgi:peptidoglycan-associated lipoprotein